MQAYSKYTSRIPVNMRKYRIRNENIGRCAKFSNNIMDNWRTKQRNEYAIQMESTRTVNKARDKMPKGRKSIGWPCMRWKDSLRKAQLWWDRHITPSAMKTRKNKAASKSTCTQGKCYIKCSYMFSNKWYISLTNI